MIRKRRNIELAEQALEITKNLDVFPKLEDDYKETSSTRGTCTFIIFQKLKLKKILFLNPYGTLSQVAIIVFALILVLVLFEVKYYFTREVKYAYEVDVDHHSKLKLNIDMTVAMSCNSIGADVMDSTSRDILTDQKIQMTETWFELSPNQKHTHQHITNLYSKIRNDYHALHSSLWFSYETLPSSLGDRFAFTIILGSKL
jgi:hypothetical protein